MFLAAVAVVLPLVPAAATYAESSDWDVANGHFFMQTGGYSVVVTNSGGSAASAMATLTVNRTNRPPVLAAIGRSYLIDRVVVVGPATYEVFLPPEE